MNRQQKRKARRTAEKHPEIDYTTKLVAGAFILKLHDKHGFGRDRLQKLMIEVFETVNDIAGGELYTLDELMEHISQEYGIEL